ncbi:MAG: class I SAM-dependent methyltransferase, partial [Kiritimatiellia bacterium]|nr:class I SAM-dependent methyltransferase [Lentisphaerota bacterium]
MQHDPAVKREKAFFNQRAETWMEIWRRNPRAVARGFYAREFRRLFRLAALRPSDVILDVGCGSGVLAPYILRRLGPRGRLHELDYAERMIEVNRRLHADPRIRFHVADVHELELP